MSHATPPAPADAPEITVILPAFNEAPSLALCCGHRVLRYSGRAGGVAEVASRYSSTRRRRRALPMTDTELRLIAALAIIGLSRMPKNG